MITVTWLALTKRVRSTWTGGRSAPTRAGDSVGRRPKVGYLFAAKLLFVLGGCSATIPPKTVCRACCTPMYEFGELTIGDPSTTKRLTLHWKSANSDIEGFGGDWFQHMGIPVTAPRTLLSVLNALGAQGWSLVHFTDTFTALTLSPDFAAELTGNPEADALASRYIFQRRTTKVEDVTK